MEFELQCRYDARQSFYGKAKVETTRNIHELTQDLYSYGVLVASVVWSFEKQFKQYNLIPYKTLTGREKTQTTTRHQKEFFKQNGLTDSEIKELFKNGEMVKEV